MQEARWWAGFYKSVSIINPLNFELPIPLIFRQCWLLAVWAVGVIAFDLPAQFPLAVKPQASAGPQAWGSSELLTQCKRASGSVSRISHPESMSS